jgi:endonuclease/exonuclease/phosphatase family metal-dependent hydrolase
MTVNLGSRLLDAVAFGRIVELERPDLVLMQECTERADYAFTDPAWYYRDDDALCLASRYPVRHVRVRYRTATPADDAFVAQYRVELPTGMVDVINVHLDTPRGGVHGLVAGLGWLDGLRANIAARREQARWVRQWLGEGGSMPRTIVAGDFNLTVESAIYGEAWSGFRNAFSERGLGWGYTKRETWFWGARIDHVLVGEGWAVANAWTAADVGSDHRPVVADLVLEADGAPRQ